MNAIVQDARPESVEVVYCDHKVQHVEHFSPDDEVKLNARGGGGTAFQPFLDHFTEQPPAAMIVFTDLENGGEKLTEPGYPVLWCTGRDVTIQPPFGRVIRIDF